MKKITLLLPFLLFIACNKVTSPVRSIADEITNTVYQYSLDYTGAWSMTIVSNDLTSVMVTGSGTTNFSSALSLSSLNAKKTDGGNSILKIQGLDQLLLDTGEVFSNRIFSDYVPSGETNKSAKINF